MKNLVDKYLVELSVPEKHGLKIAKSTLKMSDAGALIMGGMSKQEARDFLKKIGWTEQKIKKLEEDKIMNFETKTVNFVNETSLGKNINEGEKTDWKAFYKMAKDTSGKTFKEFEKKYAKEMDRPHIVHAIINAPDFKTFMKAISKFEK